MNINSKTNKNIFPGVGWGRMPKYGSLRVSTSKVGGQGLPEAPSALSGFVDFFAEAT